MLDTTDVQWPKVALMCAAVTTRGQRIRRERKARGLTIAQLAAATAVGDRTIGRIEHDESDEPRKRDILERYLNIPAAPTPPAERPNNPPRLDEATHVELALEFLRRMEQLAHTPVGAPPVDVVTDGDSVPGPPDPKLGKQLQSPE